jgi:hypothetical protein
MLHNERCRTTKKDKKQAYTLASKGDTLPALLVWFNHNLAGFTNCNNDFYFFLSIITPVMTAFTHYLKLIKFFTMIFAVFEENSVEGSYRFRVISAFESRENRSLAEIGGRWRHLKETT